MLFHLEKSIFLIILYLHNVKSNATDTYITYTYDNRDRTTKVYLDTDKDGIADTAEAQVAYLYANNRLSGIDTATTDYTLTYDTFGNVLTIKAGNYTLATYEYAGNNGKLLKLTYGNGDYEEYIYDSLERLVEVKLNGATEYIVKYDNNGRLYSLTENGITHIYEYDSLDRLVRAWQEDGNGETIISVENFYDSLGRPTGSAYGDVSATPQQYSITYKADSNLIDTYTMPGDKVNTYSYDGFERLTQKTHSSNVFTTQYGYLTTTEGNTSSLVSRMDIDSSAIDTYFTYTYDNLGNITQIKKDGAIVNEYTYDSLGQLVCEEDAVAGVTYIYTYDKSGNITQKDKYPYSDGAFMGDYINYLASQKETVGTYIYNNSTWGDLLGVYNGKIILYDAIGNPTNWHNATGLTWEARQLQSITLSETKSLAFEYNSSGIRTKKTYVETDGNTWEYSYTLDGSKIIKEAVHAFTTGSPVAGMYFDMLYYYDDSGIAAVYYDGAKYYYVKNLQGDVIGLVNASGQYVVQYVYDAWGRVVSTTGSLANTLGKYNPFRYRGYYYDTETGFYYIDSRYYAPEVSRFINADDINYLGADSSLLSYSLFTYCMNNPINRFDVNGNWSLPNWAKVAIGAVATVAAVAVTVATGGAAAPVLIGVATSTIGGAAVSAVKHRVTTGSWEGAGKAALDGAVDGFMSGGLGALGGSLISAGTKAVKTARQGITIGRNMDKVNRAAGLTDTATYSKDALWKPLREEYYNSIKNKFGEKMADSVSYACNKLYIKTMRALGAVVYDSGLNGCAQAGMFYEMELKVLEGYYNLVQMY